MTKVIPIYQAKTQLSKLVKRAQQGETLYIGAYGSPQAILAPAPVKKPIPIGIWASKKQVNAYDSADLIKPDTDITGLFDQSTNQSLP